MGSGNGALYSAEKASISRGKASVKINSTTLASSVDRQIRVQLSSSTDRIVFSTKHKARGRLRGYDFEAMDRTRHRLPVAITSPSLASLAYASPNLDIVLYRPPVVRVSGMPAGRVGIVIGVVWWVFYRRGCTRCWIHEADFPREHGNRWGFMFCGGQ